DGSIERAENADNSDLLHLHSAIAQDKCERIKRAHAESHPTDAAAGEAHGLRRGKNDQRGQGGTGQANHPHGLNRPDTRHNANARSQNKTPNAIAAMVAQPMPRVLAFVGCAEFSEGSCSPPATTATPSNMKRMPATRAVERWSPLSQERISVNAG